MPDRVCSRFVRGLLAAVLVAAAPQAAGQCRLALPNPVLGGGRVALPILEEHRDLMAAGLVRWVVLEG
jgi:hypothetical protein